MQYSRKKRVAVIVAHPDDEILWAGGTLLSHPEWQCFIACICRGKDTDRAPRFATVLKILGATGNMADMDDGPEQSPLPIAAVAAQILQLLPDGHFDLVITHNITGEYTRHRRHEEVCEAVVSLWQAEQLTTPELWMFAYEDGSRAYFPRPRKDADKYLQLPEMIFQQKKSLLTHTYGFSNDSWEAQTTPPIEAFRTFSSAAAAVLWLNGNRISP